jgi:hypothetical protein
MCLNSLLLSYDLSSPVNFLTSIQNIATSAVDNIFIHSSKLETYCDMDGATGGGGRVNSVDSRGDVTSASHRCVTTPVHTLSRQR